MSSSRRETKKVKCSEMGGAGFWYEIKGEMELALGPDGCIGFGHDTSSGVTVN